MELADIKRKALAARQFSVEVAPATFTLTIPTKLESSVAYMEAAGTKGRSSMLRLQRALVVLAVTGWAGVQIKHVLPDYSGDDSFAFEEGATETLLDAQPAWEEKLTTALLDKIAERKAAEDTAAKN